MGEIGEESQFASVEGVLQLAQEQLAEEPPQHAHRQEETGATSDPAGAECAARRTRDDRRAPVETLRHGGGRYPPPPEPEPQLPLNRAARLPSGADRAGSACC